MLTETSVLEFGKPRKKFAVRPKKYNSNSNDRGDLELVAELVSLLVSRDHEKLNLTVEVRGKAYRIGIEPDKKVPVLRERW